VPYTNAVIRYTSMLELEAFVGAEGSTVPVEPGVDAWEWAESLRKAEGFAQAQLEPNARILRNAVVFRFSWLHRSMLAVLVTHRGPRPEIVVSKLQLQNLVPVLRERGIIDDATPITSRSNAAEVKGRHVLGLLPNYLASMAASITEIPMRLTNEDYVAMQRKGLSLERTRAVVSNPVTYKVEQLADDGVDR
jgi:hypothetical protein